MENPAISIALLVAAIGALIMYALLVPKSDRKFQPDNEEEMARNPLLRVSVALGNDIYGAVPKALLPAQTGEPKPNARIESLLIRSGNPWGFRASEFVSFQYICGVIGFIAAWPVWFILSQFFSIGWYVVVPILTLLLWYFPRSKYTEFAKFRDLEFKRQLPEALDLMIISLSGGRTFPQSVREIIPNMQDGVLKVEFEHMMRQLDTGKTLNDTLEDFSQRAPNESIATFVRSVQSASEVNAPLIETLEARAAASRQEFFAMVHQKTAQLESKIWMILSPTLIPAVMVVAVAPSVQSMMQSMG